MLVNNYFYHYILIYFIRWKFAYQCILTEQVKRRRDMWNWDNMVAHKARRISYHKIYKKKQTTKKPPKDLLDQLEVFITNLANVTKRLSDTSSNTSSDISSKFVVKLNFIY